MHYKRFARIRLIRKQRKHRSLPHQPCKFHALFLFDYTDYKHNNIWYCLSINLLYWHRLTKDVYQNVPNDGAKIIGKTVFRISTLDHVHLSNMLIVNSVSTLQNIRTRLCQLRLDFTSLTKNRVSSEILRKESSRTFMLREKVML